MFEVLGEQFLQVLRVVVGGCMVPLGQLCFKLLGPLFFIELAGDQICHPFSECPHQVVGVGVIAQDRLGLDLA